MVDSDKGDFLEAFSTIEYNNICANWPSILSSHEVDNYFHTLLNFYCWQI